MYSVKRMFKEVNARYGASISRYEITFRNIVSVHSNKQVLEQNY